MTPEQVLAWVRRTTQAQGLPEKVTDPVVLERVATLVGRHEQVHTRPRADCPRCIPPRG